MVIPGILLRKARLAPEGIGVGLSNIVLYAAQPAMIINAFVMDFNREIALTSLWVLGISFVSHGIFILTAMLLYRRAPENRIAPLRFATIFTNAAYMGIPLISALLGTHAAIYASVYVIAFNIFVWTIGCYLYTHDRSYVSLKKAFLNPATISALVGMLIFVLPNKSWIPSVATSALSMLSAVVAPLSMMLIGFRLAEMPWRGFFTDRYLYLYLLVRMFLLPALTLLGLRGLVFAGLPIPDEAVVVCFVCAAAPAGTATSMFAEKYGGDALYAGKLVSVSTLFSVASMSAVALLLYL